MSDNQRIIQALRNAVYGELTFAEPMSKPFFELLLTIKVNLRTYFLSTGMAANDIWVMMRGEGKDKERLFDLVMKMSQAFHLELGFEGLESTFSATMNRVFGMRMNTQQGYALDDDTVNKLGQRDEIAMLFSKEPMLAFLMYAAVGLVYLSDFKQGVPSPQKQK